MEKWRNGRRTERKPEFSLSGSKTRPGSSPGFSTMGNVVFRSIFGFLQ